MKTTPTPHLPGPKVLADIPVRAVTLLRALSRNPAINQVMAAGGYTRAEHEEGLRLLSAACAFKHTPIDFQADDEVRQARYEIAQWMNQHWPRLRVAVLRQLPERADVFESLHTTSEEDPLLAIAKLLQRLKAEAADSDLQRLLTKRAFGEEQQAQLAILLKTATGTIPSDEQPVKAEHARDALVALYLWHADWAATAKALIRRKDWLVSMGLAERRRRA